MKILKRVFLFIVFIALVLIVILWFLLNGTKPKISGVIKTEKGEVSDKVTINRNKWGIPFIRGENSGDIFLGGRICSCFRQALPDGPCQEAGYREDVRNIW